MTVTETTEKFIQHELYKLCDGEATRHIVGEYPATSTWTVADVFRPIIEACLEHTSIEDICSSPENPSADTVHKRCNELPWQKAEQLVNEWVTDVSSRICLPKRAFITISFDLHQRPYYGDPSPEWVTGMKRKKGTNYAVTFLLVTITTRNIRCPLVVKLMTKSRMKMKAVMIDEILSELALRLPVRRVLLDRGFCQEDIINLLEDRGLEWVIAAIRKSGVKVAYQAIKTCVETLAKQAGVNVEDKLELGRWARKQGIDVFRVESVTIRKKGTPVPLIAAYVRQRTRKKDPTKRWIYCLFLYLTNLSCSARYIVKLYGKRWMIETDIRCINDFQAVTNSKLPSLRMLLFGLAVFFDALWVIFSVCENRMTELDPFPIDNVTQFLYKFCYRLICIARWFCRWLRKEILPLVCF